MKQHAVPEKETILSQDKYKDGDFISVDQFVIKAPGKHPSGLVKQFSEMPPLANLSGKSSFFWYGQNCDG